MWTCSLCGRSNLPGARVDNAWFCDMCLNSPTRTRGRKVLLVEARSDMSEIERLRAENAELKARYDGKALADDRVILGKIIVRDDDEAGPVQLLAQDLDKGTPSDAEIALAKEEAKSDPRKYMPSNEKTLKRIGAELTDDKEPAKLASNAGTKKPAAPDKKRRAVARSSKRSGARRS